MEKNQTREAAGLYDNREKFSDLATRKKIEKHLSDIDDVITEEDIKNVKTDFNEIEIPREPEDAKGTGHEDSQYQDTREDQKNDEERDNTVITPWNILE